MPLFRGSTKKADVRNFSSVAWYVFICYPSISVTETGESGGQGHYELHSELKDNLTHTTFYLKNKLK